MLGWTFDTSARTTCRAFDTVLGHLPYACLTNGGRPFLILVAAAVTVPIGLFLAVRALRAG